MAVYLPEINYMEITGFDKIFKENFITIDFHAPLSILLGGNGLGKTTLLQCIVFALTGGMNNPHVEQNINLRWNSDFFRRRVLPERLGTANILIGFKLGDIEISVRRGLMGRAVECTVNSKDVSGKAFEEIVVDIGKYDNYDSFVFIVNRLLYLPENRRSLTWDYDGQIRSLMILSNDIINEKAYRNLRAEIKNLDSAKRHTTVRINKINSKVEAKDYGNDVPILDNTSSNETEIIIKKRNKLSESLKVSLSKRDQLSLSLKKYENRRQELVKEIDELTKTIRRYEANYLNESLRRYGAKETLIFGKTINYGACPCCGEVTSDFQHVAKQRIAEGKCLVCGSNHFDSVDAPAADINIYNSQLSEKLSARDNANKYIIHLRNQIQSLDNDVFLIRKDISAIDYPAFVNAVRADYNYDTDEDVEDLEIELAKLVSDRNNFESDIKTKTAEADYMYETFLNDFAERKKRLSNIYQNLASAFLGKKVTLEYEKSSAKFVAIEYLIPVFDGEARKSPEDCSEAQRFFLDIAFRMSLIILNNNITCSTGTFICETPESALDVSYVENVVKMFFEFISDGNKLILSNNLQKLGLAHLLVIKSKEENNKYSVFDLLEYGRLSNVQLDSSELFNIRDEILGVKENEQQCNIEDA